MKKFLTLLFLIISVSITLPALAAVQYETLNLNRESIENNLKANTASFRMMDSNKTAKRLVIYEDALKFMSEKDVKLIVETNTMTLSLSPEAFKTQEWFEAAKSGEPLAIRLFIEKGSGLKVSEYFDDWYYNQMGFSRFGTSAWELRGEVLAAGIKKYEIDNFAVPINLNAKYSPEAESYGNISNLGMYVLNEKTGKWDYLGGSVDRENRVFSCQTNVPGLYIILSGKNSSGQKGEGFTDIKGHWAESDILYMMQKNVVQVTGDKKFYPNREITRAEFAVFLVRTLGLEYNNGPNKFQDVGPNQPYYQEVLAAANSGIVAGVTEDKFHPDVKITRQEIAAMLARALKHGGLAVNANKDVLDQFNDEGKIASWAVNSCAQVVSSGLMSGRSNSMFEPKSFTSRAEALVLLHRLENKLNK
ncbi:MAG TPA: S-layer homology domain-containing protein [Clostridia bacterium]|nr:S-layer homology domain-containing protein [Clostridia bacterium]